MMFFLQKYVCFSSFLKASTFFVVLNVSSLPAHAGKWTEYIVNGEVEKAKAIAQAKYKKYDEMYNQYYSENQIDILSSYIKTYYPQLDVDCVINDIRWNLECKRKIWEERERPREIDNLHASRSVAFRTMTANATNDQWEKAFDYVYLYSKVQQEYLDFMDTLNAILASAPSDSNDPLVSKAIMTTQKILDGIKGKNRIEKFQKFHSAWVEKLQDLMGIDSEQLKKPFVSPSVAVVIDSFSKNLEGPQKPLGMESKTELPTKHGDEMEDLIKMVSPQSTTVRVYSTIFHSDPEYHQEDVYQSLSNIGFPLVFSYSQGTGSECYLQKTAKGIKFDFNAASVCQTGELINWYKKELALQIPGKDCDGILDEEQIDMLVAIDRTLGVTNSIDCAERLVIGSQGDQTHLIVAAPSNDPGPLTKSEWHNGFIKVIANPETEKHALIALNYDFTKNALAEKSHSAGDYKDMAVVVPTYYLSMRENKDSIPKIALGGHSGATAILSGIISCIRGYYPTLNHLEVKRAILEGANRTFAGYDPELHGQGMVNLKRALEVAKAIVADTTSSTSSTPTLTSAKNPGVSSTSSIQGAPSFSSE